jgi:hypothetical protein
MKKITIPIIIGITAVIALGIIYVSMFTPEPILPDNLPEKMPRVENSSGLGHPDAISSGPLTITKYEHKLGENVFIIVSGLNYNEKGNIRIFMPDGRLYRTLEYDGSFKNSFNSYFKPDTSALRKICEQEELVGIWAVVFDNDVYPPLHFEIINEHLDGPDVRLSKSC